MPGKAAHRPLPDAETQSESFRQVREARRSALVEDYVELISDLIGRDGEARKIPFHGTSSLDWSVVRSRRPRGPDPGASVSCR